MLRPIVIGAGIQSSQASGIESAVGSFRGLGKGRNKVSLPHSGTLEGLRIAFECARGEYSTQQRSHAPAEKL